MSDLINYYKKYYENNGHTMTSTNGSSRVLQLQDWIKEFVPKGGKILDIGCGDMYLSTALKDYDWTGIDVNVERAQGNAITHDITQTPYPFKPASFDAIVCSETLEHIFDPRIVNKEAHRLLKTGGKYIVSTPNHDWIENQLTQYKAIVFDPSRPWTMEHIHQYNPACHENLLKEAGFKLVDLTGADHHFGAFFEQATKALQLTLVNSLGQNEYQYVGKVHQILGRMFPWNSHTIMMLTEKVPEAATSFEITSRFYSKGAK